MALVGSVWFPNIAQIFIQLSVFLIKQSFLKKPGIFIQLLSTNYVQDSVNCPDDKQMTKNILQCDLKGQMLRDSSFGKSASFFTIDLIAKVNNGWLLYKSNRPVFLKNVKGKHDQPS